MIARRAATFSEDRQYRYLLERDLDSGLLEPEGTMVFVMLNPSLADADREDRTLNRCIHFAARERCQRIRVVNLYGFVTPYPEQLGWVPDPVGPDNDRHVLAAVADADRLVVAWGGGPWAARRWKHVRDLLRHELGVAAGGALCLGTTLSGAPRHPSRLANAAQLEPWPQWDR